MANLDSINSVLPGVQSAAPGSAANAGRPLFIEDANDNIHSVEVESDVAMWGKDGFSFADLLDVVNPLQHLPVIGQIYRGITGDEISPAARLAGGTLFGGPVGLALAVANNAVESATGRDIGDNVVAMVQGDDGGQQGEGEAINLAARTTEGEATPSATAAANSNALAAAPTAITTAPLPPLNEAAIMSSAKGSQPRAKAEEVISSRQPIVSFVRSARPVQAAPTAALAQQAQPTPTLPGSAPVAPIPSMSPAAFQTLMKSIGAVPVNQPSGRPGLSAGGSPANMPSANIRGTSMEVHNMLKAYATGGPQALQPVKR